MRITFAQYRNRFCMYRTYYALAKGIVKPDGFTMNVIELPDPRAKSRKKRWSVTTFRWRIFICRIFCAASSTARPSSVCVPNGSRR